MARIIAGFAGSLSLAVPPSGTRPTSDRVREAIFSALDARGVLPGARVLDLYAGSGALGLEAISRGAASAVLVDRAAPSVTACKRNVAAVLKAAPRGTAAPTVEVSGSAALPFASASRSFYDVVFADPPYDHAADEIAALLTALVPRLAPDAVVVLERSSRDAAPAWPEGIELDRRKDYGDTAVYWLRPAE